MNINTFTLIYGAVLHVTALVVLTVLVALGKVSWAEGGPIIAGLVGVGVGVAVTPTTPSDDPPVKPPGG